MATCKDQFRRTIQVLDKGFVRGVDYMGDDAAIVQAARVSYGKGTKKKSEDRGLIRYLLRKKHTSPFEQVQFKFHCKMPIFVARQWVRHRTACLTADNELHFDLPGGIERRGNQLYKLTVGEVFERFQPTANQTRPDKQRNPYHKRDQVQKMQLRCINPETEEVQHTKIVDIWSNGLKRVFRVKLTNGNTCTMTRDHICITPDGERKLGDIVGHSVLDILEDQYLNNEQGIANKTSTIYSVGPGKNTGVVPHHIDVWLDKEEWRSIVGWEDYYQVSNFGRVRRIVGGHGASSFGSCKKLTVSKGRHVVSLNRPGVQRTRHVSQLVLEAFVGPRPIGLECCHNDGNSLNNYVENLRWDTPKENAADHVRDGATTGLIAQPVTIETLTYLGQQETYDLEVDSIYHNFVAGGLVVHNSLNEMSGRYSEMPMEFYVPERDRLGVQSTENKQGTGESVYGDAADQILRSIENGQDLAKDYYQSFLHKKGWQLSRELARINLPLSTYTEWYWLMDLHNLFHFLKLRMDSHAQYEIRVYADAIFELIKPIVPVSCEAFEDYVLNAKTFSANEVETLKYFVKDFNLIAPHAHGLLLNELQHRLGAKNEREMTEFKQKLGIKE